jgi:NitT/TauT family transport system substrate-binding protein
MTRLHNVGRRTFLAGVAAAALPRIACAADPIVTSVGVPPGTMGAIVDYAQDRGFFKNAGLDVRVTILNSGAAIASAVTGGAVEFGAVNVGSLATARLRGLPLRIVAPASLVPAGAYGDVVLVRKDSTFRPGPDFNGKTIAIVALKTVQHAAFLGWLEKRGADPKSVKMLEMPLPEMAQALSAGRIDAAITVEPFTTLGLAVGRSLGTVYEGMGVPFMVFAICANDGWLQNNAATAVKFASAMRQTAAWANTHDKDARAILASAMKLEPAVANAMLMPVSGTTLDPALIQPVIDIMTKYGFLEKTIDPSELLWRRS